MNKDSESFHFRWLKIKGNDVTFPMFIMLFFNHLKSNSSWGPGTFQSESEKCKFKRELNSSMSIARTRINARSSFLSRNLNSKERRETI